MSKPFNERLRLLTLAGKAHSNLKKAQKRGKELLPSLQAMADADEWKTGDFEILRRVLISSEGKLIRPTMLGIKNAQFRMAFGKD
jgi:hypothetical protein